MRSSLLLTLFALHCFALTTSAQTAGDISVEVERISDRVALFHTSLQQHTNAIVFRSAEGIVVVDTGVAPALTVAVRRAIEREFGSDFACLINTHGHGDHTFGNQVFADVPIIAHAECTADMSEAAADMDNMLDQIGRGLPVLKSQLAEMEPGSDSARAMADRIAYYQAIYDGLSGDFELTLPTMTFSDHMTLDLGDLTLELSWFGLSHSGSDILIWCPEEAVLCTGDVFYAGDLTPYVDSERLPHVARWLEVLSGILEVAPDETRVIPSHEDAIPLAGPREWLDLAGQEASRLAGRESGLDRMKAVYEQAGADAAAAALREMHAEPARFFLLHPELDSFAYRLMMEDKLDDALGFFLALAEIFPENDVAFDSLGEVYVRQENIEAAIKSFEAALRLNPDNQNAARRLGELKAPPPSEL